MSAIHTSRLAAFALLGALALSAGAASAETLGQSLDAGRISPAAFAQLIAGTGLSANEARDLTLSQIALIKTDSN